MARLRETAWVRLYEYQSLRDLFSGRVIETSTLERIRPALPAAGL
jgi:hypothetical protein